MELIIVDSNKELVNELKNAFAQFPEVKIFCDGILNVAENSVVSPANSFGRMDGGIDLIYANYFGWDLEERVMDAIDSTPHKGGDFRIPVDGMNLCAAFDLMGIEKGASFIRFFET